MTVKFYFDKNTLGKSNDIEISLLKLRISSALDEFATKSGLNTLKMNVTKGITEGSDSDVSINDTAISKSLFNNKNINSPEPLEKEATSYLAADPYFTFDNLIYSEKVKNSLTIALKKISEAKFLYEEWGLNEIEKNPKSAINLFGPPGTGKTAAAHAMASELGKKIIIASYADIESKYHGEGPKNVQAIFKSAEEQDAVLFIDEADSLLSQRLSNVTQGSEQAINSMRSQLLINMEMHKGLIVFATNFAANYDKAFDTRVIHLEIPLPDFEQRIEILKKHLPSKLPLAESFNHEDVASVEDVCGRDIKNAVINAAVKTKMDGNSCVSSNDIKEFILFEAENRKKLREKSPRQLDEVEKKEVFNKIQRSIKKKKR